MFQHVSSDALGAVENPSAYHALIFSLLFPTILSSSPLYSALSLLLDPANLHGHDLSFGWLVDKIVFCLVRDSQVIITSSPPSGSRLSMEMQQTDDLSPQLGKTDITSDLIVLGEKPLPFSH